MASVRKSGDGKEKQMKQESKVHEEKIRKLKKIDKRCMKVVSTENTTREEREK